MIEGEFLQSLIKDPSLITKQEFAVISEILNDAKKLFSEENLLLEFIIEETEEVFVIGDIHGNLDTLLKIIEIINEKGPRLVIFLGDIVDRGSHQMECLILILVLKILNPQTVYILKGNHETFDMNQTYGFFNDFINRYKDYKKFRNILELYHVLPICSIINHSILCLHGGIPEDFEILKKMKGLKTTDLHNSLLRKLETSLFQIIWNDPKESLGNFMESYRGSDIKFFGEQVFEKFMELNNLKYIIRAHECFPEGYRWFFNNKLLSIFSSANYRSDFIPNPASYAIIKKNTITPKILEI